MSARCGPRRKAGEIEHIEGFDELTRLGAGGVGDVYRARRVSTGGLVAIKILRDWSDDESGWRRSERELAALLRLKGHPNVVHVEEIVWVDGAPALVMEYAPGGTVAHLVAQRGHPLDIGEVVLIGTHVAAALHEGHALGIAHLDVKPHNVLIGAFGQAKLCDYGIAALTQSPEFRDRTMALSLRYASPEQIVGVGEVGIESDVYSLASSLVHVLTGASVPPRTAESDSSPPLMTWTPPGWIDPAVARQFSDLIIRCLAVAPERRPPAAEVESELDRIASSLGAHRLSKLVILPDDVTVVRQVERPTTFTSPPQPTTPSLATPHLPADDAPLSDATVLRTPALFEVAPPADAHVGPAASGKAIAVASSPAWQWRRGPLFAVSAALVALVVLVVAVLIGGGGDEPSASPAESSPAAGVSEPTAGVTEPTAAEPEVTDAPVTVAAPRDGSELAGMKGTTPRGPDIASWIDDVAAFWVAQGNPTLTDVNYAAESYDAVIQIALAVELAGTDGSAHAAEIVGISGGGDKCTTYADCLAIIEAGGDPDYDGISGPQDFNGNGEPLRGNYTVLTFGDDNRISDQQTALTAEASESAVVDLVPVGVERDGDGVLKIGSLLPRTGNLAFLGPPEFAGVEYAIDEINAAGGVLGRDVEYVPGDSGDTTSDTARRTADRLVRADVDAIIGAASSGVTLTVIDTITAAGITMFSPANTSPALSDYADNGLYFRNAPPDGLQGALVAQLIIEDGASSAYILNLDDAYGNGIAAVTESVLTESGVEVLGVKAYDPAAASFDAEVDEVVAADPDAVVLISFDEGSRILRTAVDKGIGPTAKLWYGTDGNMSDALGENFDAGL